MRVIGIDGGRANTKAVAANNMLKMPSMISEWYERPLSKGGNYELELESGKYFVGDLAKEGYFRTTNAAKEKIHQELKLFAITSAAALEASGDIAIVTGVPVNSHLQGIKSQLSSFLLGRYRGGLNSRPFDFRVQRVEVVPEGAAAFWGYMLSASGNLLKDPAGTWRVVDVGSKTVNTCCIVDQRYLNRESGTLPYGCYDYDNSHTKDKAFFARRIAGDLKRIWSDYQDSDQVLLSGGGALLLENELRRHFDQVRMVPDPLMANAQGFFRMGMAKWQ